MSIEREQRLYDALKRITSYQRPDKLQRSCEKQCDPDSARSARS